MSDIKQPKKYALVSQVLGTKKGQEIKYRIVMESDSLLDVVQHYELLRLPVTSWVMKRVSWKKEVSEIDL